MCLLNLRIYQLVEKGDERFSAELCVSAVLCIADKPERGKYRKKFGIHKRYRKPRKLEELRHCALLAVCIN